MQTTSGSTTQNNVLVSFATTALKLKKVGPTFSSFNPSQSLPSVRMDGRKQFNPLSPNIHIQILQTDLSIYFLYIYILRIS